MPRHNFSRHSSNCSAIISFVRIAAIATAFLRWPYSFTTHLVSSGLCSWIYFLIFPCPSAVRVDINTELVVKCVTLVFATWRRYYFWIILPTFRCSSFPYFSLKLWLRPHFPLLSSSPLLWPHFPLLSSSLLCYAWICVFKFCAFWHLNVVFKITQWSVLQHNLYVQ